MNEVFFAFWFFFPASIANMSPIFANNIPILKKFNHPIDSGGKYKDKRILGDHKTWRGLLSGGIGGLLGAAIQMVLFNNFAWAHSAVGTTVDYSDNRVLLLGLFLGLGALVGDSIKSFFKRQADVPSGKGWFPFDQIDFVLGAALFSTPFVILSVKIYLLSLALALIIHPIFNILGWILKLKPRPF